MICIRCSFNPIIFPKAIVGLSDLSCFVETDAICSTQDTSLTAILHHYQQVNLYLLDLAISMSIVSSQTNGIT